MIRSSRRPLRAGRHCNSEAGFSLIEVMIATGVFAMIATILFAALWNGQAQVSRMSRGIGDDEQLLTARRILKSWIEATTVAGLAPARLPGRPAQGPGDPVFLGEPLRMTFHATPMERDGSSGLYRIELAIERERDIAPSVLSIRRQRLDVLSGKPSGPPLAARLLTIARPLAFTYADEPGTGPDGTGQRWSDAWDEPERLPTRVQITDGRTALLTVSVGISKDPRCVLFRGTEAMAGGECLVR